MKIRLREGLPYIAVNVSHKGRSLRLENVLLDTGSAGVILPTDKALSIGLTYEPEDVVHRIRGVGGAEFVYTKRVDLLAADELQLTYFELEVGAMDYGFELDGIIGMDFLLQVGAVIDLSKLEMYPSVK